MTKSEFLEELRARLSGYPDAEVEESLRFYGEMIDDRMEEGIAENEAVLAAGSLDEIVAEFKENRAFLNQEAIEIKCEKPKAKKKTLIIVLIAVSSPIWVPLGVSAVALILAFGVSLLAAIITLLASLAAFALSSPASLLSGIALLCNGVIPAGLALIGASFVGAGLAILLFVAGVAVIKGSVRFVKWAWARIKRCFGKEGVK